MLDRYITVGRTSVSGAIKTAQFGDWTYSLLVPIEEWPEELRREWGQDATVLFREPPVQEPSGLVCLCLHVTNCPVKGDKPENRECVRYGYGICLEATWALRGRENKLRAQTVAMFMGITDEELKERQKKAHRKLVRAILDDPILVEALENLGIKGSIA